MKLVRNDNRKNVLVSSVLEDGYSFCLQNLWLKMAALSKQRALG